MLIRPVEPAEYDRVGALTVAAYEVVGAMSPEYREVLRDTASRVGIDGGEVLVAIEDGVVLGSVARSIGPSELFEYDFPSQGDCGFRMLAVAPEAWGRGVGSALVDHCLAAFDAAGCTRATITSMTWMTRAHAMYERRGFVRWPELDVTYPSGVGWCFTKPLRG